MQQVQLDEDLVRTRAYQLWEQDGRPEGRSEDYWFRALFELEADGAAPPDSGQEAQPSVDH